MSNYNIGDIVRMTRQAMGISQEELSDGICSVQTLSRIENGKVNVKKKTYQQLMERMGRDGTKNYSVLSTEEYDVLDIMLELNNALFRHDIDEADKLLELLKQNLDSDNDLNHLYLGETECIVNVYAGKMTAQEGLVCLENLIEKTIPQ